MKQLMLGIMLILLIGNVHAGRRYSLTDCSVALKPDLNNDGVVDYKEIWQVGRSYAVTKDDYRYNPKSDINCDQRVDETDWDFVWQAYGQHFSIVPEVSGYLSLHLPQKMYIGKKHTANGYISLRATNHMRFTLEISQKTIPAWGLQVESTLKKEPMVFYQRSYLNRANENFLIHLTPKLPGKYRVEFTALVPESGESFVEEHEITVLAAKKADIKLNLHISQNKQPLRANTLLPESQQYKITLKTHATGKDVGDIIKVTYVDEKKGRTFYKYSIRDTQSISLSKSFVEQRLCRSFHVLVTTEYGTVKSDSVQYCGQQLEVEEIKPVLHNSTRARWHHTQSLSVRPDCAGKQILMAANADVSKETIKAFVKQSGGMILAHHQSALQYYQVSPIMGDSDRVWQELLAMQKDNPEISWVELLSFSKPLKDCPEIPNINKLLMPFKSVTHDAGNW